jgi:hypothetical protein
VPLVNRVAEQHGRSRAVEIFAQHGVKSGPDLKTNHSDKIAAVIASFREALS